MLVDKSLIVQPNSISCYIGRICELDENFEKNGIMWVDFYDLDGSGENQKKHDEEGTVRQKVIASWTLRAAYAAWINPPVLKYKGRLVLNGAMTIDEMEFKCDKCDIKGKGRITLNNADMQAVNLQGGAPMPPVPAVCGPFPGTAGPIPPVISGAKGNAVKVESAGPTGEIEFNTKDAEISFKAPVTFKVEDNKLHFPTLHTAKSGLSNYEIELKLDKASVIPWCTDVSDIKNEDNTPDDGDDGSADDKQLKARERENFINAGDNGDLALCMAFGNSLKNLYCVDLFI